MYDRINDAREAWDEKSEWRGFREVRITLAGTRTESERRRVIGPGYNRYLLHGDLRCENEGTPNENTIDPS